MDRVLGTRIRCKGLIQVDSTLLFLFLPFFTFSLTRPSLFLYLFLFLLILSIPMQWLSHILDLPSFPVHIAFFTLSSYFLCIPVWWLSHTFDLPSIPVCTASFHHISYASYFFNVTCHSCHIWWLYIYLWSSIGIVLHWLLIDYINLPVPMF